MNAHYSQSPSISLRYLAPGEPVAEPTSALMAIAPANTRAIGIKSPLTILPTPSLGCGPVVELWSAATTVFRLADSDLVASTAGDLLLGAALADPAEELSDATQRIYSRIFEVVRSAATPHLVRLWNYFPRINVVESIERYQRFCVARFDAFQAAGYAMSTDLPAASSVGSDSGALTVVFLASSQKPQFLENPRQISAFSYPERYGPRSPSFSRGAILSDGRTLLISGTASIVGHETVHQGDLQAQVEETLHNIDAVIAEAFGEGTSLQSRGFETLLKVYVRRASDQPRIAERLEQILPTDSISYLHADICRADLLVEIEAFMRRV